MRRRGRSRLLTSARTATRTFDLQLAIATLRLPAQPYVEIGTNSKDSGSAWRQQGGPFVVLARQRGGSVPRSRRSMSLESAPDRSYDVPPADERKGKTKAESDRHLGNPIVTHRSTLIRYPAGTMTPPRQKNAVGVKYW
jgi:hypothetical protein